MKRRVLIVDDDRLVADTLSLVFQANGYESEARYSASEGLDRARSFAPALLLTDFTMPGQSGLELAEAVEREMPECKLMILTAYQSNRLLVHRQGRPGASEIRLLYKPVSPEVLLREVQSLLAA